MKKFVDFILHYEKFSNFVIDELCDMSAGLEFTTENVLRCYQSSIIKLLSNFYRTRFVYE